jgi:hypothetical protein
MLRKMTYLSMLTLLGTTVLLSPSKASADQAAYLQSLGETTVEDGWGASGKKNGGNGNGAQRNGDDNVVVPEPGTVALLGLGLTSLRLLKGRRKS